jgi:adenylate cyclase 8
MREEYLNPWTLKFKEPFQEACFCQLNEDVFRSNILCMFTLWTLVVLCQFVIIPKCEILFISFSVTTIIMSIGFVLVMAGEYSIFPPNLREFSEELIFDRNNRTIISCIAIILMSFSSSIGLSTLDDNTKFKISLNISESFNNNVTTCIDYRDDSSCLQPKYVVFTWVLILVALAAALKLYYLVKSILAIALVTIFCILILFVYPEVFQVYNQDSLGISSPVQMVILLIAFLTMVIHHARLVEVTARLDFIWKEEAERELSNMKSNRHLNDLLIKNVLPEHVAMYYLNHEISDDIYSKSHDLCGVMFASIPNFKDFYSEDMENGKACIRVLNEIICDFDALLDDQKFSAVEKIKTVGQ